MKVWHSSENPYPPAWTADPETVRVTLPNRHFDPEVGARLINEYLDQWALCDEVGLNIMVNEHHSTSTCLTASVMLPLAILARETKKARLLALGAAIGVRSDPLLVAEELSYIDVISHGRLEMGLVKGVALELTPASVNPATLTERFWEAHDLVLKAMTSHDGPFNFEGDYFQYRNVNIWPRPYQQPHPAVWMTSFGPQSTIAIADHDYKLCAGLIALGTKKIFDAYRARYAETGRPAPPVDNFGYLVLLGVGHTEAEGHARLKKIKGHFENNENVPAQFQNPPGYAPVELNVQMKRRGLKRSLFKTSRDGKQVNFVTASIPELIDAGAGIAGNPDQVFEQIRDLYNYLGGFGNLLAMMQGGYLAHEDTQDNIRLFAKEVLPRLQELVPSQSRESDQLDEIRRKAAAG